MNNKIHGWKRINNLDKITQNKLQPWNSFKRISDRSVYALPSSKHLAWVYMYLFLIVAVTSYQRLNSLNLYKFVML